MSIGEFFGQLATRHWPFGIDFGFFYSKAVFMAWWLTIAG
jgi:hypothetical protein